MGGVYAVVVPFAVPAHFKPLDFEQLFNSFFSSEAKAT